PLHYQQPRIVEDGFWLHDPRILPGSMIRYRYQTGGQRRIGTHRINPGPKGQFIYTGDQPEDIEILDVMPAEITEDDAADEWGEPEAPASPPASIPSALPAGEDWPADSAPASDNAEPGSSGGDFPAAY